MSKDPSAVEDQEGLMEDHCKINNIDSQKNGFGRGKFAVNAEEDNRERNNAKFPDPETVSVEGDHGSDDRVEFDPAAIQDDRCEQCVEYI